MQQGILLRKTHELRDIHRLIKNQRLQQQRPVTEIKNKQHQQQQHRRRPTPTTDETDRNDAASCDIIIAAAAKPCC